jgi:hypothetical protein
MPPRFQRHIVGICGIDFFRRREPASAFPQSPPHTAAGNYASGPEARECQDFSRAISLAEGFQLKKSEYKCSTAQSIFTGADRVVCGPPRHQLPWGAEISRATQTSYRWIVVKVACPLPDENYLSLPKEGGRVSRKSNATA